MGNFNEYARLYDVIYAGKDYKAEAEYVIAHIQKHHPKAKTILNLGCGTGKHDIYFIKAGYKVTGVDISDNMIAFAKKNAKNNKVDADFICADIRNIKLKKKFDVVVSLFHVLSYQTANADVEKTMQTAQRHLNKNGLFLFDFWYGPGVLTDLPAVRNKKFKSANLEIARISTPTLHTENNVVDVLFELYYKKPEEKTYRFLTELHEMRYFFLPELSLVLTNTGFSTINAKEWLTEEKPTSKSWNVFLIAKSIL
jgi:SAM-dependent methyltransferase